MARRVGLFASAVLAATAVAAPAQTSTPPAVKVDSETISGLGARNIGSAAMSGRVSAIDAAREGSRLTVYVGAASGGVWKSVNGGTTYKPVFDKQPVQSIGAITIDPKNPKIVWVGTGRVLDAQQRVDRRRHLQVRRRRRQLVERGPRRAPSASCRILVDPIAHGHGLRLRAGQALVRQRRPRRLQDDGRRQERGRRSSRAATSSTGCSMISMDPQNPSTLFAGMWDFRRKGWTFRSGGESPEAPSASGSAQVDRRRRDVERPRREDREGPASRSPGGASRSPSRRRSRTSSTPSSRPSSRRTASIAPTTAARRGRPWTAARSWCGGPSTSPTSSSTRRTRTGSTSRT